MNPKGPTMDISTNEIAAVWDTIDLVHRQAVYIAVLQHRLRDRDAAADVLQQALNDARKAEG